MTINNSFLFQQAWTIARNGAKRFGGTVRSYFDEALKLARKQYSLLKVKAMYRQLEVLTKRVNNGKELQSKAWAVAKHITANKNYSYWEESSQLGIKLVILCDFGNEIHLHWDLLGHFTTEVK